MLDIGIKGGSDFVKCFLPFRVTLFPERIQRSDAGRCDVKQTRHVGDGFASLVWTFLEVAKEGGGLI